MFCTRVAWVCLLCLQLCKEEGSSPVSAITERRDVGLYEVPMSMSLLGFGMGTMLANFYMCGIMLVLRAVFIAESFPGFSMAIILDCLHSVGILFSMKHLFSIVSSHLWDLGPRFFSCSTRTSSLSEALLFFFSITTPFLYSSSLKGYIIELLEVI